MNRKSIIKPAVIALLSVIFSIACQAQSAAGCFTSTGAFKPCGSSWDDTYNGVTYHCYCNCAKTPPAECSPSGSSSSSSSGRGSGYSPQVQMAHDLLQPLVTNLFKWLMSGPSPKQGQQHNTIEDKKKQEEAERAYQQRQEEYQAMMLAQISNAKSEFERLNKLNFGEQKQIAVSEFKDRFAKSEATKAIKQANCAAYGSLQAARSELNEFIDSKELKGSLEKQCKTIDFTNGNNNGCPEVNVQIPEVNALQTISIQEMFYNYVGHQTDSIRVSIDALKDKKIMNNKALEEKMQKIEVLKNTIEKQKNEVSFSAVTHKGETDKLTKDALNELELATAELQAAQEQDQRMKEDISLKEKSITALEKMRSTYDADQKKASPEKSPNK